MSPARILSGKILKGAIVVYRSDSLAKIPFPIVFQYNPDHLERTIEPRLPPAPEGGTPFDREPLRVIGPPRETIRMSVVLDAADQLEHPASNVTTTLVGLQPSLAALEDIMYPSATQALDLRKIVGVGSSSDAVPAVPLTLLVWGLNRIVPVRVAGCMVIEEAFDHNLNPIRARLDLTLVVLTDRELSQSKLGSGAYVAYQAQKETLAALYKTSTGLSRIQGILPV